MGTLMAFVKRNFMFILVVIFLTTSGFTLLTVARYEIPRKYNHLELFTQIFELVNNTYLEPVDPDILAQGMIEGMLLEIGQYCYLSPVNGESALLPTPGEAELGAVIGYREEFIKVIDVQPGSPADAGGLEPGDVIISINDVVTPSLPVKRAERMLTGDSDQVLKLIIQHASTRRVEELEFTLKPVKFESGMKMDLTAAVPMIQLSGALDDAMVTAVRDGLDSATDLPGLVIDVRHLNRGMPETGAMLADLFIPDGTPLVSLCDRAGAPLRQMSARDGQAFRGFPVVVVHDYSSAGPAEVFIAAMTQSGRGTSVGESTFGMAFKSDTVALNTRYNLVVTREFFCTLAGDQIQQKGLNPDLFTDLPVPESVMNGDVVLDFAKRTLDTLIQQA